MMCLFLLKEVTFCICIYTDTTFKCINLPIRITCELNSIVFLITCTKCNMLYAGETGREFRNRISEHRNSLTKPKPERNTTVSRHFTKDNHRVSRMEFSVLEWGTSKFEFIETGLRRHHVLSWIFKLHTLTSLGINQHV